MMMKNNLIDDMREYFSLTPYMPIIDWAQKNIDFSLDTGAERNFFDIDLTPHLREILQSTDFKGKIKEITVCGIEQHGKTLIEQIFLLYSMIYTSCNSLTCYPSDDLATDINLSKLRPLMLKIPQLKKQMQRPKSIRQDRYRFSNFTSFWQGAGSKIMSKSCKIRIADEIDQYPTLGRLNNVEDLRKRGRSFSQSMFLKVCTPTTTDGKIWKEFLKSSQGYWTLWCDSCNDWTMRSCDLHNLQFESVYNEELKENIIKPDSCVLVCPKCGAFHTEDKKQMMNIMGKYIHKIPERIDSHPGFQFGCLCSLFPFMSWDRIAEKILECGKRSDIDSHYELDNSWKGLPYKRRQIVKEDFERLREHCWKQIESPSLDNVEMVFLTADTQDDRSVVAVFAIDVNDNLYLLKTAQPTYLSLHQEQRSVINMNSPEPIITVEDMLNQEYLKRDGVGIKPTFMIIDRQGHRQNDVQYFARRNPQVIMYQGSRIEQQNWKLSENIKRLCLVAAKHYQVSLIYYLYSQKKRGQNYLYFYPDIEEQVIKQIACVKPDATKKFGNMPQNWEAEHGAQHDFFDVVKMAYFGIDFAIKSFKRDRFRFCKSPTLLRRWEKYLEREVENEAQVKMQKQKSAWLDI